MSCQTHIIRVQIQTAIGLFFSADEVDDVGGLGRLFEHRYAVPSLQTVCKNAIRDWIYRFVVRSLNKNDKI